MSIVTIDSTIPKASEKSSFTIFHFIIFRSKTWTTSRCSLTSPLFLILSPKCSSHPTMFRILSMVFPTSSHIFFQCLFSTYFPMFERLSHVFHGFPHVFPMVFPRFPHVFPRPRPTAQRPGCRTSWPSISTPRSSWPWRQLRPCRRCHRKRRWGPNGKLTIPKITIIIGLFIVNLVNYNRFTIII